MTKQWKNLFKPWILERGQEYYECGKVAELVETDEIIRAEVSGNQTYQVEIQRAGADVVWMHLCHFEGMYDALFEELSQYPYLEKFRTYEMTLREWDSERTLKLYVHALKFEMDRVCDRKEYRRVVGHLHGLEAYPGGGEETRKLTAYWHEYHKRRPAMKDELCRAGYPEQ